jgi:hypothetical protein
MEDRKYRKRCNDNSTRLERVLYQSGDFKRFFLRRIFYGSMGSVWSGRDRSWVRRVENGEWKLGARYVEGEPKPPNSQNVTDLVKDVQSDFL